MLIRYRLACSSNTNIKATRQYSLRPMHFDKQPHWLHCGVHETCTYSNFVRKVLLANNYSIYITGLICPYGQFVLGFKREIVDNKLDTIILIDIVQVKKAPYSWFQLHYLKLSYCDLRGQIKGTDRVFTSFITQAYSMANIERLR